jgi:hypothetical protein
MLNPTMALGVEKEGGSWSRPLLILRADDSVGGNQVDLIGAAGGRTGRRSFRAD